MVSEGIKDLTNQGFTNISSSRESTIMFDLSKFFSHICHILKWFENIESYYIILSKAEACTEFRQNGRKPLKKVFYFKDRNLNCLSYYSYIKMCYLRYFKIIAPTKYCY